MVRRPLLLLAALACLGPGCAQPGAGNDAGGLFTEHSPLRPLSLGPDAVALDIVFVRRPLGDPAINEKLQAEVDEQVLGTASRERLAKNGFWVALAGEPLPPTLEDLLKVDEEKKPREEGEGEQADDEKNSSTKSSESDVADMLQPRLASQLLILPSGKPTEILTRNDTYDECFVILWQDEKLNGERFKQAQCVLVVTPHQSPDGRVRLNFLPQIRYGSPRVEHQATLDGTWRYASQRARRSFHELAWDVTLSRREIALSTCRPDLDASLAYHFFTLPIDGATEQNLILVRLSDLRDANPPSLATP